jgi:hypothetical protein
MINNNFITLTDLNKDTTVILNINFIQLIGEQSNGSYIVMAHKENSLPLSVKETPNEIMKLMKNKLYN